MDRVRRRRQQRLEHDIALRHPGPFVEQPRRLVERLDVDFDDLRAERGRARDRLVVGAGRGAIAEEHALPGNRHAEPHALAEGTDGAERARARIGIGAIRAGDGGERRPAIVGGQRKDRNAVERAAGRHHARGRDEPEARLEADDVVEPRGHAPGAGGVGAERERHEARRDRDRRARARSAGDQRRIEGIARDAVGRTHADQAGRELIEVGLADDDGAGAAQPRHGGGVPGGLVGEGRAGRRGRHALGIDIVFDRDRNAVERAPLGAGRRQRLCLGDRGRLVAKADEQCRIGVGANPRIAPRHRVGRRRRSGAVRLENFSNCFGQFRYRKSVRDQAARGFAH